ncbi:hypothetical protein HELRODRAFT_70669 [Helobdella robusta]|uniref:GIY-YIG domain-containing protein n=1 Tax=Helobdella robusta TaxID=6412 RepID=T1G0A3_HELRO|nr:hypothetical protein HELRODRAFT_70669 [Helobdella robusta]ESN90759.1 hypothetical protein HELRODRAFT_70669 [Helobdella robusta]
MDSLEQDMSRPFLNPGPSAKWRAGIKKSCFNYILVDPRVSKNIPKRVKVIGQKKAFLIFIESIFYVGKGQKARPYEHFKEAANQRSKFNAKVTSKKVAKILEIWRSDRGVVSLCAFQNAIPVESFTREACMIEAIGLENLTNVCKGQVYGPASNWSKSQIKKLGAWLLWKCFLILLNEGERQIRYRDVGD